MSMSHVWGTAWLEPRKASLRAITLGNVSWLFAAGLAFEFWPSVPRGAGPAERLALAAQLAAAPAIFGLLVVCSCLRLFDTQGAEDPLAGQESARFRINQRVLQNTVEQGFVFLPLLTALALRIDERHLAVLPIAVTLWCAGRVLFWLGYHKSPLWRMPGFDWTFNTSLLVSGWLVSTWL